MRTNVPEKLLKIVEEIDTRGDANLTRLTVMKKWFERPERMTAFAVWIARRAVAQKGKAKGEAAALFKEAQALLAGVDKLRPELDRNVAQALLGRLRQFQNEYRKASWGAARIINDWNLFLVEQGLAIYLGYEPSPSEGYKLAADYCEHYNPLYAGGLNGPSRAKIMKIVRFMFTVEALEDEGDAELRGRQNSRE